MIRRLMGTLVLLLPMTAWVGCASVDVDGAPAPVTTIDAAAYDATLTAAVTVLRDRGFVVDRQDRRFGVVTTQPLGAATIVEPWKLNNPGVRAALVNTLNDQRRVVTVTLTPGDQLEADRDQSAGRYVLGVEVQLERRQAVTRRVGGAPSNQVFSDLAATPVEMRRRGIEGSYWRPVGREPAIERQITEQIIHRIRG